MRIRLAIPDRLVTPEALEAALEATTLANAEAIRRGEIPHAEEAIRKGVKWQEERFHDGEHFDLGHLVERRKWGDCDDLAPWLAGSMRAHGEDSGAHVRAYRTGPNRWHVVTQLSDGTILDPSRWAGMGKRSAPTAHGISGAVSRPFARYGSGALGVMPHAGQWWGRCDLPCEMPHGPGHIASHARAKTPEGALSRAVAGALICGEQVDSPLCDRAQGAAEMLLADREELYDNPHVGSLFGNIFHGISHLAKGPLGMIANPALALGYHTLKDKQFAPLRSAAMNLLPGGGMLSSLGPSALSALSQGGGSSRVPGAMPDPTSGMVSVPVEHEAPEHGQHMMIAYHPAGHPGPVVMRF